MNWTRALQNPNVVVRCLAIPTPTLLHLAPRWMIPHSPNGAVAIYWECLADKPGSSLTLVSGRTPTASYVGDWKSVWVLFHTAIVEVAVVSRSRKITGVNGSGNLRTRCWRPWVRGGHYHVTPMALILVLESRISAQWVSSFSSELSDFLTWF